MAKEIKIPEIAEGVESATVTEILVSEGDKIEKEQALITVESDKASVEIPAPEAGTVKVIKVSEGDEVSVGDVIVTLEASGSEDDDEKDENESDSSEKEDSEKAEEKSKDSETKEEDNDEKSEEVEKEKEKKKSDSGEEDEGDEDEKEKPEKKSKSEEKNSDESDEEKSDVKKKDKSDKKDPDEDRKEKNEKKKNTDSENDEEPTKKTSAGNVAASPGVRRLARELGVDINAVAKEMDSEKISEADVKAFAKKGSESTGKAKSLSLPDFSKWGEIEKKSLSGIRVATAKNVSAAWTTIPHVFQFDEAEISGIGKYIDEHKEKAEKAGGKLTITAVLVKIAAVALKQFPKFNASIDIENEEMILKKYINIGIAVDTEKGLLVPVVKNADKKSIIDISVELTELSEKARDGKLEHDEMQGGSFTISNLGGIGGTNFTPIVYHPQVAILGVSKGQKKPFFVDGKFEPRDILPLSLSYDHRMIDGAEGVRFIDWIARALEDPYSALLGA